MIYYLMIIAATFLFSTQFVLNNGYRKESGNTWNASAKFSLYSSVTGFIALGIVNKFHFEFSIFSLIVAVVYAVVCISLAYSSIKAFTYANLSVYSVFAMIGGMLLPFVYGIICGEEFKLIRVVCCVLIAICVAMSINKAQHSKKAIKYYMAVFTLNGLVGVISKFHQSYTELCVDSGSFMMMTKIVTVVICTLVLLSRKERSFYVSKKALLYSVLYSVVNSMGNLMLLVALLHIPASVQYPVVTGGTIVFSTLFVIMKKEKLTKREIIAAVIAFVATIFMAF